MDRSLVAAGFQVDSLDIDPKCGATWTSDVLEWETWRHMMPGRYDFIWASPPCVQYSIARTTAKTPRNLALADSIVERTLEIIQELAPLGWLMENPASGLLKTREVVAGLPFRDVCYCMYSDGLNHRYRKPTRLWGVLPTLVTREMCTRRNPCQFSAEAGRHPVTAQRIPSKAQVGARGFTLAQLYSMPRALTDDVADAAKELYEELRP